MTRITCSQLPLFMKCAGSLLHGPTTIDTAGEPARMGSAVHAVMDKYISNGKADFAAIAKAWEVDLAQLAPLAGSTIKIWNKEIKPFCDECASTDTEFHLDSGWLAGTVDVMSLHADDHLVIVDWKTGWLDSDVSEQLRGYAYGVSAWVYQDVEKVSVFTVSPRLGTYDVRTYERAELEAWAERVKARLDRKPTYSPGSHCTYCRNYTDCAARSQVAQAAVKDLLFEVPALVEPNVAGAFLDLVANRNTATCAKVHEMRAKVKTVEKCIEMFDSWLRQEVQERGPIPNGDGREIALNEFTLKEIDPLAAWKTLQETFTDEELASAVKVLPGKIGDLVSANATIGKGKAKIAFFKRLEDEGSLTKKPAFRLEERKAKGDANDG